MGIPTYSMTKTTFFVLFFLLTIRMVAAQDMLSGTWVARQSDENIKLPFDLKIEIGQGEKQMLFPARISIIHPEFEGVYQCIILKKSIRSYSISTIKFKEKSVPFDISPLMRKMTGIFQVKRDMKGNQQLELERIQIVKPGLQNFNSVSSNPNHKALLKSINNLVEETPLIFIKKNDSAWIHPDADSLLQPKHTPEYMGITDTLFVNNKKLSIRMNVNKDNDIVSSRLLQNPVWDQVDSKKEREEEVVILDTGLNILGFFADDFGKTGYSTASVEIGTDYFSKTLGFGTKENEAFTFIAQKIFCRVREEDISKFDEITKNDASNVRIGTTSDRNNVSLELKNKNIKTIGNLRSRSNKLKFAIWDDAVEDGDTISIMVNGTWVASGFTVRKITQLLVVNLLPGSNSIIFQADNLGSIVPNTSVVEIIDGKKRKSYFIETDLDHMNRINILFDVPK
jgi:hypothetical protein